MKSAWQTDEEKATDEKETKKKKKKQMQWQHIRTINWIEHTNERTNGINLLFNVHEIQMTIGAEC